MNTPAQPPIDYLLGRLLQDLSDADHLRSDLLWQLAAVVLCGVLAWWASAQIQRRLAAAAAAGAAAGAALPRLPPSPGLLRMTRALIALALLMAARLILVRHSNANVVTLFVTLVLALALVRVFQYALQRALPDNPLFALLGRAVGAVIWFAVALHVTGLLPDIVHTLQSMALPVGVQTVSMWTVLRGLFWIFVAVLVSLWIGSAIDRRLMAARSFNTSLLVGLSRLIRAVLIVAGALIVLPLVGIDLTVLSVFGGALGVGLGFGLQKIASNYVSGFIILFDRAVSIGDVVTVENFLGEVRTITTRYVVLRAPDGREAIVPNEKMITETVLSHSLGGRQSRITVTVQVGYRSDLDRALALLREIALDHHAVLAEPATQVMVTKFADSGIELELWCWVLDAQGGPAIVKSDLCLAVWRRFAREGIEIPFPQREVRILGAESPPAAAGDDGATRSAAPGDASDGGETRA